MCSLNLQHLLQCFEMEMIQQLLEDLNLKKHLPVDRIIQTKICPKRILDLGELNYCSRKTKLV